MELELNVDSVETYLSSLKKIARDCNSNGDNAYFPLVGKDFVLCRYSKRFEKLFGTQPTIVNIEWGGAPKLQVTLDKNSLYVIKIAKIGNEPPLWVPHTNQTPNVRYQKINQYSNQHDGDLCSLYDAKNIDLGFWHYVKEASEKKNLESFFKSPDNQERMFVYVAEAIRFPSLFGNKLNNQKPGLYFPMYECWENHFTKWDDFSKRSISRFILGKLKPEQKSIFENIPDNVDNVIDKNQNTEKAIKLVQSLNLVREDVKEQNLPGNTNTRTYVRDVIFEVVDLIKKGS